MADETGGGKEVHPGSFVGDSIEEFKKLPTWGKIAIGLLFVGVAYLGYRSYKANQATASTSSAGAPSGTAGNPPLGQGGAGIQTVPGGSTGQVPVLPGGLCPQYDPSGQLVAFAPCGQGGGTTPQQPPSQPPSGGGGGGGGGGTGGGSTFTPPVIPYGQYKGPNYSNLRPGTFYNYNGTNYLLSTGAGNRLYGQINGQGQKILLYGDVNAYRPPVNSPQILQPGGSNGATQRPNTRIA